MSRYSKEPPPNHMFKFMHCKKCKYTHNLVAALEYLSTALIAVQFRGITTAAIGKTF